MQREHSVNQESVTPIDEFDVAIIGCGMAGLAAGIAAAESGVSPVILEKAPEHLRGGQTRYTESFRIPTADVDLDLDFHIPDYSSSDFYQDVMRVTNGEADPELTGVMVNEAGEMFEWLTEYLAGENFEWQTTPLRKMYGAGRVWHEGEQLVDKLVAVAEKQGVEIVYEAEARSLIQENSNRIRGVTALVEDEHRDYCTDGVIIACGGYESNSEKRTRYYGPSYEQMKVRGVRFNTGEAIDMALDIGASPDGQWSGAHMAVIDAGSPDVEGGQTLVSGYQYGILLNHNGHRFVNEGEDTRAHTYAKFGREIFEQPYHEAFLVLDETANEHVLHTGPSSPITADSIESLTTRLGIENESQAVETFVKYNEACDSDADFDPEVLDGNCANGISPPKSNWAIALDSTSLVGYPVTGGITFSFGGLAQTEKAAVIDTSYDPIPGLYAAGNAGGGIFYDNYPGGSGLTKAAVFGRIAGKNASKLAEKADIKS